jgi:battenin
VAWFNYIPSIWIIFPIVLFEGLVGGAIYVNAFYLISEEVDESYKEFCLSSVSFWYSLGILSAGVSGLFVEPWIRQRRSRLYFSPLEPSSTPSK